MLLQKKIPIITVILNYRLRLFNARRRFRQLHNESDAYGLGRVCPSNSTPVQAIPDETIPRKKQNESISFVYDSMTASANTIHHGENIFRVKACRQKDLVRTVVN